jgi:NhaP-type Na+/H+ or K+/H+ antiporter
VLLPPVIFESGYTLNPETFFKNFDAVSMFAFIGTFTSTLVVGAVMYFAGLWGVSFRFSLKVGRCRMPVSKVHCSFQINPPRLYGW